MDRYIALVDRSAEGAFGFDIPDLPGCTAMGDSFTAAYDAAIEAMADWAATVAAEGRPVPRPSSFEDLTARPDVADEIAAGASIAFVPMLRMSGRSARANLSIDEGLLADIDEEARRRGLTRSTWVASVARDALRKSA